MSLLVFILAVLLIGLLQWKIQKLNEMIKGYKIQRKGAQKLIF